jgi:D-alanine-D-alanine ligase
MPDTIWRIATERVKWSVKYQKRHGIDTAEAQLPDGIAQKIQHLAKRTYRALDLSGYACIDFRMDSTGKVYVIEANANPQLAEAEDFAQSAKRAKLSYAHLLERIMALGIEWQPHRMGLE